MCDHAGRYRILHVAQSQTIDTQTKSKMPRIEGLGMKHVSMQRIRYSVQRYLEDQTSHREVWKTTVISKSSFYQIVMKRATPLFHIALVISRMELYDIAIKDHFILTSTLTSGISFKGRDRYGVSALGSPAEWACPAVRCLQQIPRVLQEALRA